MLLPDRADKTGSDRYVYDPGRPTVSPRVLGDEMESRYAELLNSKDVVAYRSLPLSAAFRVVGPMSATLHVSANVPEIDIFVRISEQDPGRGHFLLAEGKCRVRFVGEKPVRVAVDLWHTAVQIAKGHRIVVDITSAAFPIYARNLNTGENSLTGTTFRTARVTVHRGANTPSFVELSVVP